LIDIEQLGDTLPERCVVVFDEPAWHPPAAPRVCWRRLSGGAKVIAIATRGSSPLCRPAVGCVLLAERSVCCG